MINALVIARHSDPAANEVIRVLEDHTAGNFSHNKVPLFIFVLKEDATYDSFSLFRFRTTSLRERDKSELSINSIRIHWGLTLLRLETTQRPILSDLCWKESLSSFSLLQSCLTLMRTNT